MVPKKKRTLSIFVDEGGDFGPADPHSPLYVVAFVFHDQSVDIKTKIDYLSELVAKCGYQGHAVHTYPLIRREAEYAAELSEVRYKLFRALYLFSLNADIGFGSVVVERKDCPDQESLVRRLSVEIHSFLISRRNFFSSFDNVHVYYDSGQMILRSILLTTFSIGLSIPFELKKVIPSDYALFQTADLCVTLETLRWKAAKGKLTKWEIGFFGSKTQLVKSFLRQFELKHI